MNFKTARLAAYASNITMAIVSTLSPLLFLTFHNLYDISYTLLGLLVMIGFVTQLTVDVVFSLFSDKFNIRAVLRIMPILAIMGFLFYGLSPFLFPNNVYAGIVIGTVIFSASAGLSEVLVSPLIAAIPSKNPDKEMSKLHSIYAFGVVFVVVFSTAYLYVFKSANWMWLPFLLVLIPALASVLFFAADIPDMNSGEKETKSLSIFRNKYLWVSFFAIFLGGAAECTMSQWVSSYLEIALELPKSVGDIFGVALFSLFLGLGRFMYAKIGKNIEKVLLFSAILASLCYITAAISPFPIVGLLASALTGFATAMLWPGNLIVAENRFPNGGVVMFAFMAAGGDLGASVGPQLVGMITDKVIESPGLMGLADTLSMSSEQLGMRIGLIIGALFPLVAIAVFTFIFKTKKKI